MSVGTKSIQRAAAKAAETEGAATEAAKTEESAEEETEVPGMTAERELTQAPAETEKTVAKKEASTAKKTSAGKAPSTSKGKTSAVKKSVIPSVSPQVAENMRLTGRERYQVNDELPTYLL